MYHNTAQPVVCMCSRSRDGLETHQRLISVSGGWRLGLVSVSGFNVSCPSLACSSTTVIWRILWLFGAFEWHLLYCCCINQSINQSITGWSKYKQRRISDLTGGRMTAGHNGIHIGYSLYNHLIAARLQRALLSVCFAGACFCGRQRKSTRSLRKQ